MENSCNGELLILPVIRVADNQPIHLALQSVPVGPQRKAVGIYYKEVSADDTPETFAANWSGPYMVTEKPSAYSTMIQLRNGDIAFYYEEADQIDVRGYDMVYREIPIDELTSGAYRCL